jgi:hypothetical protein
LTLGHLRWTADRFTLRQTTDLYEQARALTRCARHTCAKRIQVSARFGSQPESANSESANSPMRTTQLCRADLGAACASSELRVGRLPCHGLLRFSYHPPAGPSAEIREALRHNPVRGRDVLNAFVALANTGDFFIDPAHDVPTGQIFLSNSRQRGAPKIASGKRCQASLAAREWEGMLTCGARWP